MRALAAILLALALATPVAARECTINGAPCTGLAADGTPAASTAQLAGVQAAIPLPSISVPPGATPTGAAGVAATYQPSDAVPPSLCRRTSTTTAADGTFSVSWTVPLKSTSPWAGVDPIWISSTMPPSCWMTSATGAGVTGKCLPAQTATLTLSAVTAGATVSPFGAGSGAAALTVKVHACEPTQ